MPTSRKSDSPTLNPKIMLGDVGKYLSGGWRVLDRLRKEGKIKTTRDPLDHRRKLVSTKDLDELKQTLMKDE